MLCSMLAERTACLSGAILLTLVAACGAQGTSPPPRDAQVPERVDPRAAICASATAPPTFDLVQMVFDQNCTSCHAPGADLDLFDGHSCADLIGKPPPATEACGGTLVVPGDPAQSYLYQKLTSSQPCFGQQMPLNELYSQPLPDCVVAILHDWIAAGAPCAGPAADAGAGD
jgi:hypothetical protein